MKFQNRLIFLLSFLAGIGSASADFWEVTHEEPESTLFSSLAYGNGTWIVGGSTIMRSFDGENWETLELPEGESTANGVAFGNGRFVILGRNPLVLDTNGVIHSEHNLFVPRWSFLEDSGNWIAKGQQNCFCRTPFSRGESGGTNLEITSGNWP
jgi:hypothetical protein